MMFDRREFLKTIKSLGIASVALPVLGSKPMLAAVIGADQEEQTSGPPPTEKAPEAELSREQVLEDLHRKGWEALGKHGNCAQSSFAVLQEHFGLEGDGFHRALSPFPGIAVRGETCGAVTGALVALGLVFGVEKGDTSADRKAVYHTAREFCSRYEEARGSTKCRDIHIAATGKWYDTLDPDQMKAYHEAGGADACRGAVASGVTIAAELILDKTTT